MAARRRMIRHLLTSSVVLTSLAVLMATDACSPSSTSVQQNHNIATNATRPKTARLSGQPLYAVAAGLGNDSLQERRAAARKLAENKYMASWVVLLLVQSQMPPAGDEAAQYRQAARRPFELAVVAAVIDSLPEEVDRSVLLALTYLLQEEGEGEWSETRGLILQTIYECRSQPIRTLARARLKDILGVDHEYDAAAWRTAIMKMKVKARGN